MKKIVIAIILLLALLAGGRGLLALSKSRTFQLFGEIIPRIETNRKVVALTFDDGPQPVFTKEILDTLKRNHVKGTFYLTGTELEKYPKEGRMIATAGEEIGNHTYTHSKMMFITPARVRNEIERTDTLIRKTGYRGLITFRPPGCKKLVNLPYYLMKNNRKTITWDIEPNSYPEVDKSSKNIVKYVTDKVRPGSIILLHVMYKGRSESRKAIDGIVKSLRNRGYEFVTVSELLTFRKN